MGTMIPLSDASRRPTRIPLVTVFIILVNGFVFVLELMGGEAFVTKWAAIPAQITSGHHWITILTSMFMHGSWLHIIGNMIYLWAFSPEIEDAMGPWRYFVFYNAGALVAMLAQIAADPHSTVPNLGASGAIAAVMGCVSGHLSSRSDSHDSVDICVCADHIHSGRSLDRLLVPHPALQCRGGGTRADGRSGLLGAHRRLHLRGCHGASV